jgi:hydrogenase expression/formation protein HypC
MCLGIPGKVIETYREHDILMGKVEFGGISKRVCLEHVVDVQINDYVLVHVGFALSRIDEAEAKRVFDFLNSMDQLDELSPFEDEEIELHVTPTPDRPPEPTRSTAPSATE